MVEPNGSSSVTNTDCSKLQELLKAGKWEEADTETLAIMLRATNREQEGWLDLEDIQQFPDSELNTINRLWLNHSNGHFGFSVQKRFWRRRRSTFFWDVGWVETLCGANGLSQGRIVIQAIFDITAPQGHLPRCILINSIKRNSPTDYHRDQNIPGNYHRWWWGPGDNLHRGQKVGNAYFFLAETEENCHKDLECILSRQYLE